MLGEDTVVQRIHRLSDKQACHIVKSLTQDVFSKMPNAPSFDELVQSIEPFAKDAGIPLNLTSHSEWYAIEMGTDRSGEEARVLLEVLATQAGLGELVNQAIDRYVEETLDLGIISIGVAIAMVYVAIAADIDLDLGWFRLKKKGLSSGQQKEVVIKTLPGVAKAIAGHA